MRNRICKLFGIEYPIISVGMVWCNGWRLASAVSNNGGLGLIAAARCNLPLTERHDLDPNFGLLHLAAIGISEVTDALAIVVSEEKGTISLAIQGELMHKISIVQLTTELEKVIVEEA